MNTIRTGSASIIFTSFGSQRLFSIEKYAKKAWQKKGLNYEVIAEKKMSILKGWRNRIF